MEEISFKELVGILYRNKILIIGIIIASVVLSVAYSFFIAVPMYHARVECEINGINTGVYTFDQENHPGAIADALIDKVRDPKFMEQVSKALAKNDVKISGTELGRTITFSKGIEGKSIIVSAKYSVKKDVAQIANIAADLLSEHSAIYLKDKLQQQLVTVGDQMKLAKANAETALSQYNEYLNGSESVSRLQSEVNMSEALLVQLKGNMISGNVGTGKSQYQLEQEIIDLEAKLQSLNGKFVD